MRLLPLALYLVTSLASTLSAQAYRMAENWHFGPGLSVDFSSGQPELGPPSAILGAEGVVSLSDTDGNLLFYTNGGGRPSLGGPISVNDNPGFIWNRNGEVMYNMRGQEGGGFSALQSSIALPDPAGEAGVYYLFTMEEIEFTIPNSLPSEPEGRGLRYFVIDMNLEGGLGGVRTADVPVYQPSFEGLDATRMADGSGYWIIINDYVEGGEFVVVPLTAAGVGDPVRQVVSDAPDPRNELFFSPDGGYVYTRAGLFGFDNATGRVGPLVRRFSEVSDRSVAFTADSRYFYAFEDQTIGQVIVRYALPDGDREAVALLNAGGDILLPPGTTQLGPDGHLYFVEQRAVGTSDVRTGLSRITCPAGSAPTQESFLVDFTGRVQAGSGIPPVFGSLPVFDDGIFRELARADTTRLDTLELLVCPGEETTLTIRERTTGPILWSTGDTTATVTTTAAGVFTATYADECGGVFIDAQRITRPDPAALELTLIEQTRAGCDEWTSQVTTRQTDPTYDGLVGFILPDDLPGEEVPTGDFNVGDTLDLRTGLAGGRLSVRGTVNGEVCSAVSPVMLTLPAAPPLPGFTIGLVGEPELCAGREATLFVGGDPARVADLDWTADGDRMGDSLTVELMTDTDYAVDVTDTCGLVKTLVFEREIAEFCDCAYSIPEIISPNGDGTNDVFRVFADCPLENYGLVIFNRWGDRVFDGTDPAEGWEGRNPGGEPANFGTYLYRATFRFPGGEENIAAEGQFVLVR